MTYLSKMMVVANQSSMTSVICHIQIIATTLTLILAWVGDPSIRVKGDAHAPCYNCEFFNLMQGDEKFHDRQINSQCQYPCQCYNKDKNKCKAGVNTVKDGCDCCYMCARQQGDLCNYKDKCDEEKGLYCDFILDGGLRGICRAREAKPCLVNGQTYKDAEEFKPDCRRLCTCQNGQYACTSLCPQEDRTPSRFHCPHPRLVNITGKCCREWTCPLPGQIGPLSGEDLSTEGKPSSHEKACKVETIPWSACSVTCGMGISMRVTNDNEDCQPIQQRRLCLVRPCELNDKHLKGRHCKNTWRAETPRPVYHEGCQSAKTYRPKYCSTCKRNRCCTPDQTKTLQMEFLCDDNRVKLYDVMWIKSCKCHTSCD